MVDYLLIIGTTFSFLLMAFVIGKGLSFISLRQELGEPLIGFGFKVNYALFAPIGMLGELVSVLFAEEGSGALLLFRAVALSISIICSICLGFLQKSILEGGVMIPPGKFILWSDIDSYHWQKEPWEVKVIFSREREFFFYAWTENAPLEIPPEKEARVARLLKLYLPFKEKIKEV